jgi:hypothetical protein
MLGALSLEEGLGLAICFGRLPATCRLLVILRVRLGLLLGTLSPNLQSCIPHQQLR